MRASPRTANQVDSPVESAYALLPGRSGRRPLLDLSQAAPPYPPAPVVLDHVAKVVAEDGAATYVDLHGLPQLRSATATDLNTAYPGGIRAENVMITAGCNQAFCVVVSALAAAGDQVLLPLPYYFNHDMWLRLNGIEPIYLEPGPDLVPRARDAEALVTERCRVLVLVSPGNPSGVTLPPAEIEAFAALARRRGVTLVLDETYRSFRDAAGPAHRLYDDPRWPGNVVTLHSFSKDLALPGYRVGAAVASPEIIREAAKLLDCVAICAPRIGQEAAWAGLTRARRWRAGRAQELAARRSQLRRAMATRPGGFELLSCGAFFAWVRHPFTDRSTSDVVAELITDYDILVLPGTAFLPEDRGVLRLSVSNLARPAIEDLSGRLNEVGRSAGRSAAPLFGTSRTQ